MKRTIKTENIKQHIKQLNCLQRVRDRETAPSSAEDPDAVWGDCEASDWWKAERPHESPRR